MNLTTLHPMVVHIPMALAVLQPILILALIIGIAKNLFSQKSWWIAIGLQAILFVTAFLALQTGEIDEEIVEKIVKESLIENHEEAAKLFTLFVALTFVSMIAPLVNFAKYRWTMTVAFVASLFVFGSGVNVGKLGGELVYTHNAAAPHVERAIANPSVIVEDTESDDSDSD